MAKQKCPEFENHERWLVAYADMMTLLFALFVVLYSIMNVEMSKMSAVSKSIRDAFGYEAKSIPNASGYPSGNSRTEGIFSKLKGNTSKDSVATRTRREIAAIINADIKTLEKQLFTRFQGTSAEKTISGPKDTRVVSFQQDQDGLRITLLARGFFDPGSIAVKKDALPILAGITSAVKNLGKTIRIEGHTDSSPYNKNGMTNWELSSVRASWVVRFFINQGMPATQIYAAGFAETRPIAPNDTEANQELNRRIDIKLIYDSFKEYDKEEEKTEETP